MFRKFVFVLTYLLMPVVASAICDQCKPKEKIYVQLEDLIFDSSGIWFKNGQSPIVAGAEAIHIDSLGYYVAKDEQTWQCPVCRFVNQGIYPGFWGCWNCGFPFR